MQDEKKIERPKFNGAVVHIGWFVWGCVTNWIYLLRGLYDNGVRYQAGWFRLNQRNPAGAPQRDAAARVVPEPRPQQQNDDDRHPQADDDDAQVISRLICLASVFSTCARSAVLT